MRKRRVGFCIECGDYMPYVTGSWRDKITIRGTTFWSLTRYAACKHCCNPMYISEINDANINARLGAYKRAKGKHLKQASQEIAKLPW